MATIRKRNDRWQVQVRRQGFAPVARSFRLRTDAQEWAREMERQADRQELPTCRKALDEIRLGDLLIRYRDEILPDKKSRVIESIILNAFLKDDMSKNVVRVGTPVTFAKYRDSRLKSLRVRSNVSWQPHPPHVPDCHQ
jgi:hypothetical protein